MKTSNEELNTMIDEQKAELTEQKEKIARLIRTGKDLKNARAEMATMRTQMEGYVDEIAGLREQVDVLAGEKATLQTEKTELQGNLTALNDEFETTKAVLTSEKDELTDKAAKLSATVTYASVVKVNNVMTEGLKVKGNGKTAKTKNADKVDQ